MAEVNRLCVRILVHQEDVKENPTSVQERRDSLRELAQAPVTCLVGSMKSLSEAISHLTLLQSPSHPVQISSENENLKPESTAGDDRQTEKPPSPTWLTSHNTNVATEKRIESKPKMVELYQCPPFNDLPTTLPHDTAYASIVRRVVQAQRHLVHKCSLKASFQSILSSPTVEHFVIDSFWWLFLHNFQPDRKTEDRLFCRIAENYIRILTQNLSTCSGTAFLRDFPSTLSQTLYCCFSCSFPQSYSFRNQAFLTFLCSIAYQWIGGICPAPEVYKTWDFEALEPDEASGVWESEKRQKESGSSSAIMDSVFSGTAFGPKRLSHAVYEREELKHCVFNVWGNSPLLQQYMTTLSLKQSVGYDLLVRRTQIHKLPPADSLTYRDVVRQALHRSSSQRRVLCSLWEQHTQELANLQQKHIDQRVQLLRKHKKILSQRSAVHKLCQLLVPPAEGEEDNKTRSEQLLAFDMAFS
ncbi:protein FAM227A-like [Salminus brasiliensis]|uniref:protein FAM227A-like n=1 Tax=Salminus brasiliensis TaxID=930266 RepID=UPI003B836AB2